ncbi:MAG: ATP-binding protein, partial [Desulfobacterales bacterium]
MPHNPLLAESLYLTRYIEKAGSGTQLMIALCREAGLPEPDFEQRSDSFVVTLWRDWLTDEMIAGLDLNARQRETVKLLKSRSKINNTQYQKELSVAKRTASLDLNGLVSAGVIEKVGTTG